MKRNSDDKIQKTFPKFNLYKEFKNELNQANCSISSNKSFDQDLSRRYKIAQLSALVVIVINCFWLFNDFLRGGTLNLFSPYALTVIIFEIIFSAIMIIVPFKIQNFMNKYNLFDKLCFAYYILIIIGVGVLTITKNQQLLRAGTAYELAGISLSTYYLFILVLSPLPSKIESYILGAVMLVMYIAPALFEGKEMYSMIQHGVLRLCMVLSYLYVRNMNFELSSNLEKLSKFSLLDQLTSALNRRALEDYFQYITQTKKGSNVAVYLLDIDDFKKYNDNFTHVLGDEVLIKVCDAINRTLKDINGYLFRYGGEEFIILITGTTDEQAVKFGLLISQTINGLSFENSETTREKRSNNVTATIGCANEIIGDLEIKKYILNADNQMYLGKDKGKNCVVFKGEVYRNN